MSNWHILVEWSKLLEPHEIIEKQSNYGLQAPFSLIIAVQLGLTANRIALGWTRRFTCCVSSQLLILLVPFFTCQPYTENIWTIGFLLKHSIMLNTYPQTCVLYTSVTGLLSFGLPTMTNNDTSRMATCPFICPFCYSSLRTAADHMVRYQQGLEWKHFF